MARRIVVVMMTVGLCAAMAQAAINATGDVIPADPATWTSTTQASVGNTGVGSLTVDDGSDVLSYKASIGREAGSTGYATVSGAGSTWADAYQISVGTYGDGTLNILDGAAVSSKKGSIAWLSANSTGALVVDGPGSTWTYTMWFMVGGLGHGTMSITNGGAVRAPLEDYSEGIVGLFAGMGEVTVDGAGSIWEAERFRIGWGGGHGTLDITNGGLVNSAHGSIGVTSPEFPAKGTGIVTVDGAGSAWTNSGRLIVGVGGDGTLNITGGAEVTVGGDTRVASPTPESPLATGEIHFDNGTLTTGGLFTTLTDLTGTGTINTNGMVSDADLVFDATHGLSQVLTLNGPGQNITVNLDVDGTASMGAGYNGNGSMHIADGVEVQSLKGYVGYNAGSTGVVTVDGAGSTWANSSGLQVAYMGDGTLTITGGGVVSSTTGRIGYYPGSTGVVTVDGVGSTWTNSDDLDVGYLSGNGTLNVTDGGTVVVSDMTYIAPSGNGAVTVSGAGSTLTSSDKIILGGYYGDGDGTLAITDGGTVSTSYSYLGYKTDSTGDVTVDGPSSTLAISSTLIVGFDGDGTLDITDGGSVSSKTGKIGYVSGSTGVAIVSGTGSTWTTAGYNSVLNVGKSGAGLLNITNGGLVSVEGDLAIDFDGGGDSFINMATGGMLALYGQADDSLANFLALIDGTDAIQYGGIDILDWDTAGLDYQLAYLTGGDLAGYTMLTMNSGWGDFDLDTDVDALDIDALGDAIRLGLAETMYDLSGAGEDGTPDGVIDINDLDYLVRFLVDTTTGHGTEYGDFNLDGLVNTTDLTRLATYYGSGDTWAKGNANRNIDLTTDVTDLTILATYFGFGTGPDTIPEPASAVLFVLAGLTATVRRRRRKR